MLLAAKLKNSWNKNHKKYRSILSGQWSLLKERFVCFSDGFIFILLLLNISSFLNITCPISDEVMMFQFINTLLAKTYKLQIIIFKILVLIKLDTYMLYTYLAMIILFSILTIDRIANFNFRIMYSSYKLLARICVFTLVGIFSKPPSLFQKTQIA